MVFENNTLNIIRNNGTKIYFPFLIFLKKNNRLKKKNNNKGIGVLIKTAIGNKYPGDPSRDTAPGKYDLLIYKFV
jgi:hypothetical protein